jgi:hypothetical protein
MARLTFLIPEFVQYMPERLVEGVLYISRQFEVAIHLCACGCGEKTVTPFGGWGWKLTVHEDDVTLNPSIGNYQFACRSHYWIENNQVRWL